MGFDNHQRALISGIVFQAMAFQHIKISTVRQSTTIPVVLVVFGMIDDTAPAVENRQL